MPKIRRGVAVLLGAVVALGCVSAVTAPVAQAKRPHTVKKIVRPVHRNGTPVRGYRVLVEDHSSDDYYDFDCWSQSPVSVSSGVDICGITADSTIACWRSTPDSVLCLRDPRVKKLVRIYYGGSFTVARRYKHVTPIALNLQRYGKCTVRNGGAWDRPTQHPNWFGYYGCISRSRGVTAVYGPAKPADGIVRSKRLWRVSLLRYDKDYNQLPFRTDGVRVAYYVGTAR